MKSTVSEKPCEKEIGYPCLKRGNNGLVVLMTSEKEGTVVNATEAHGLGKHYDGWLMGGIFHGSVCLENT